MDTFLPVFTLLALIWAVTERQRHQDARQRAEDLQHDLFCAQALGLKHQREAFVLRSTNELLGLALAKAHARENIRRELHHSAGWGQLPDTPAWHRPQRRKPEGGPPMDPMSPTGDP
jgi:hypothetical protein